MSVDDVIKNSIQACPITGGPQTFVNHLKMGLRRLVEAEIKNLLHDKWLSMPGAAGLTRYQGAADLVDKLFEKENSNEDPDRL